jgi:NitT/TauT family transport system ATP-binding protein
MILALQDISFDVEDGEFIALIGPSGCGKSTLLRILANLILPTSGEVHIGGKDPREAKSAKQIGWLAQNPALLPWRTVMDNISLAQKINPQNNRRLSSPLELLRLVDLEEFAESYPFSLSGGMAQRAALARTLATGAKVWLMDEPFAALDELTREMLSLKVSNLWEDFKPSVIWITHSIYEAARLADRVFIMSPRPGVISAQINIDLPRPRSEAEPGFQEAVLELRSNLNLK